MGRKIASWKGRLLSTSGREIFIKAIAQAASTYMMSFFMLPDSMQRSQCTSEKLLVGPEGKGEENGLGVMGQAMLPENQRVGWDLKI